MKKYLVLVFIFFAICMRVFALEVVYPKKNECTINASSTFFIGSTTLTDKVTINGEEVKTGKNGAFAHVVPLKYGKNTFVIKSGLSEDSYEINRPFPCAAVKTAPKLLEYPVINNFYVKNDGAPLRTMPVNSGINRIAHLPIDTNLLINGENGNFYRVYLNSRQIGWIAKSDVEQRDVKINNCKTEFSAPIKSEDSEFITYTFNTDVKIPFSLKEENGLTLQLFNVNVSGATDNTYTLNIPIAKLFGYEAVYENNKFILRVRKFPKIDTNKPLSKLVIAVDAGHGGCENGAIGPCGDKEKDINLAITKKLQQELVSRGAKVVMTRESDTQVPLQDRVDYAKKNNAQILVSVHSNALPDGQDPLKNRGTSVYYYHNQAKPLADSILNSMTTQLETQNDKVRQGSLALTRPTACISVLVEVAYIINPDDYALLTDSDFQAKCAKAIADGIENYILN